ncbi:MAG: branched-chain amino acid ABC transporter permease [Candidatus Eremiobacteraeota bacterium]|nr:branched-chain amino acid ABC transporter permease [Candidatus Eremiobacteraeota bacterium]MBV8356140.1 branched-chain amino acid ABC transporter permease [Candidatus Eremiobacteraeota bacterium]
MMRYGRWIAGIGCLTLALALPQFGVPTFYISLLTQTWIYAIVAMSLDLLVGFTGLVNFAQAAFFGAGAYAIAIGFTRYHVAGFVPGLVLGALAAVVVAAIFALVALRAEDVGFIIITIALNQILWGLAYQWVSMSGGDNGITGVARPLVAGLDVSGNTAYYYVCFGLFVLVLALLVTVVNSPFGLVLRGVRETPRRMRALGYNVWLYRYLAILLSAALAGIAGVLFAWYNQFVGPGDLSLDQTVQFLIIVILGGIGTLYGQVLGAALLVFLSNGLSALTQRWELILGAIYFIIVMYAPDGLVGLARRLAVRLRRKVTV